MKQVIKSNIKIILGFILGLIWSSGIVYAAVNGYLFDSDEVSYDNTTSNLTSTNVQSALDELYVESTSYQLFESRVSALENKLYPVGSYYITTDSSFDPNSAFGGNWILLSEGKAIISAGSNYTINSTYGSNTHRHSLSEAGGACITVYSYYVKHTKATTAGDMPAMNSSTYGYKASTGGDTAFSKDLGVTGVALYGYTDNASTMQSSIAANIWYRQS